MAEPTSTAEPTSAIIQPLQGGDSKTQLQKVHFTHDAMIDAILANPTIRQRELADLFGFTESWISTVLCSDAFQARLAVRRNDLVGNSMLLNFNERLRKMALKSIDRVEMELEKQANCDSAFALEALKIGAKHFGPQGGGGTTNVNVNQQVNQQFVVRLPGKAESAQAWAEAYGAKEGGLQATTANTLAVPPIPPALEAMCVSEPMDATPDLIPVGSRPDE